MVICKHCGSSEFNIQKIISISTEIEAIDGTIEFPEITEDSVGSTTIYNITSCSNCNNAINSIENDLIIPDDELKGLTEKEYIKMILELKVKLNESKPNKKKKIKEEREQITEEQEFRGEI